MNGGDGGARSTYFVGAESREHFHPGGAATLAAGASAARERRASAIQAAARFARWLRRAEARSLNQNQSAAAAAAAR